MKIMIIDDDELFSNQLKHNLLSHFDSIDETLKVDIFSNHFSQINLSEYYHLAFVDIELIEMNGIDLARQITLTSPQTLIIFVSAHSQLIYESRIVRPFFFIRKNDFYEDISIFYDLVDDMFTKKSFINLSYKAQKSTISTNDIIYIESFNHMLKIVCKDHVYYDNRTLQNMISCLSTKDFIQIHRSYVINLNYLLSYLQSEVILTHNIHLSIGRSYKKKFKKVYQEFLIQ